MEARRQHQPRPVGQQPVVLAVLVHDRQPLGAPVARAGGRDIDDAGVEIALFAQQPLVDHVGHDVRDAPPVALRGGVGGALDLGLRQDVPQPEFHPHLTAAQDLHVAGHQRLGAGHLPVLEIRRGGVGRAGLDERRLVDQPEQPAARQVGADHPGDLVAKLRRGAVRAAKVGNRDRNRRGPGVIDVDHRGLAAAVGRRAPAVAAPPLGEDRNGRGREQAGRAGDQATAAHGWIRNMDHAGVILLLRVSCNAGRTRRRAFVWMPARLTG